LGARNCHQGNLAAAVLARRHTLGKGSNSNINKDAVSVAQCRPIIDVGRVDVKNPTTFKNIKGFLL
jgi:hypothetical protein